MYKLMFNTKDTVHALFLQEALQKGPGGTYKFFFFIREGGLGVMILIIKKRNFWGGIVFKILYPLNNSYRTIGILINIL